LSKLTTEIDAPGADGFAGHFNPPLKQQRFDVPITQGRAVVKPDGMADDRKRESVPWKLLVAQHGLTLRQQLARTPQGARLSDVERWTLECCKAQMRSGQKNLDILNPVHEFDIQ